MESLEGLEGWRFGGAGNFLTTPYTDQAQIAPHHAARRGNPVRMRQRSQGTSDKKRRNEELLVRAHRGSFAAEVVAF